MDETINLIIFLTNKIINFTANLNYSNLKVKYNYSLSINFNIFEN